jgi:hypothetical protein
VEGAADEFFAAGEHERWRMKFGVFVRLVIEHFCPQFVFVG